MKRWHSVCLAIVVAALVGAGPVHAQSTAASLAGTVADEQGNVLPGATIIVKNVETGRVRATASDATGNYQIVGLPPGRYEMTVELAGFGRVVQADIVLNISQQAQINQMLKPAAVQEEVTVTADVSLVQTSRTELGTTITTKQIEELPIAGRNFVTLAQLTPGITSTGGAGISSAGGLTRNNTFLLDGLSLDDDSVATQRGSVSVDAIKEFIVLSNNFSAEYGQAAGAIINVLTRSGTNQIHGRGAYFHRDDSWDATAAAAKLVTPPLEKSRFEQRVVAGWVGGPVKRDRVFFFGSAEHTDRETDNIVTSSVLSTFRPSESTVYTQPFSNPQFVGKVDANLSPMNVLTVRYRIDRDTQSNLYIGGLATRERGTDRVREDQDIAVMDNQVLGSRGLNEFRFQFGRRVFDWTVDNYCPQCPTENRPGIQLGKQANMPQGRTEDRIQILNAFTYNVPDKLGDHTFKAGVDMSFIDLLSVFHNNLDGTFTFSGANGNLPFNPADARTYPAQFTQNVGDPELKLNNNIYAFFLQDQWKPRPNLTVNYGIRWDYEDVVGIDQDTNNWAPRFGVSWDPIGDGRTVIRGGGGIFYDQIFLNIPLNAENAKKFVTSLVTNPGYPDPRGPNPNRPPGAGATTPVPSTTRFAEDNVTPYSGQFSVGMQRELMGVLSVGADFVVANGHGLMRARDLNYPDLNDPLRRRPDPTFQRITVIETQGNSWYKGLQVGVTKRHSNRHSYTIAYTLAETERDTEDFNFTPQDMRDYDAERGPALNDATHRLSTSVNYDMVWGIQLGALVAARSGLPYNVTTGSDNNRDTFFTDRPTGTGRNSARGASFWQLDLRIAKAFRMGGSRLELVAEAFNITNQKNWSNYDGNQASTTFGRPTNGFATRQVQLGARYDF